jgi:hypothetical protein
MYYAMSREKMGRAAMKNMLATAAMVLGVVCGCSSHTQPTAQATPLPPGQQKEYCPQTLFSDGGSQWICDSGFTPYWAHACDNNGRNAVDKTLYAPAGTATQKCPANSVAPGADIQIIQMQGPGK